MTTATMRRMIARYEGDTTDIRRKVIELNAMHDDMRKKTQAAGQESSNRANEVVGAMNRIRAAYAGVAGLVGGLLAHSMVQLADSAKSVDNQLKAIGAGSDQARKKIYALAIETRTPLEATVGLMRSIAKSLPNQELDQTIKQVGTLNRLLTIGGLDSGQRGSVVLQFGQALQSGVLSGDELRALRESAPLELMEAIAKRAGGTVEQLRKMGEQGVITRAIMVGALEDLEQVARDKFGNFDATVGESMSNFRTALVGVVGEMDSATQATATMADIIAGVAGFMTEHAEAAGELAGALATVAQYALLAAGARGLAGLAPMLTSAGAGLVAMATGATTAAGAMALLRGALGSVMAMLGGPTGLAIFAATAAIMATSQFARDFGDNMEDAADKIETFNEAIADIGRIQGEIKSDSERLKEVNEEIARAIRSQATAAETTAVREKAVLEGRIAQNRELLEVQKALAEESLREAQENVASSRLDLASRARTPMENFAIIAGGRPTEAQDNEEIEAERRRLVAKQRTEGLSDREQQWLADYMKLSSALEEVARKQRELYDVTKDLGLEHVLMWKQHQEAVTNAAKIEGEAISALVAEHVQRDTKIRELEKQRELALKRLNTAGLSSEDRMQAVDAVRVADEQIRKLTDVGRRVEEAKKRYDEMAKSMAGATGAFDPQGVLRNLMTQIRTRMDEIVKSGDDVNNVELSKLEAALGAAEIAAQRLGGEMLKIAEMSFDRIYANFDKLQGKLQNMGLPYADVVAGATPANTNMIDYIKRKEAFQPTGKWDENAYRAGYGSDAIYRRSPDGVWEATPVTEGMKVSQEEANYSLMKRLETEFLPPIVAAIGADKWQSYSDNQKAAMASLSWNYGGGSWQKGALRPVAEAARSGTPQDVADAIAALAMQTTKSERTGGIKTKDGLPMNYHRRMEEAGLFGSTDKAREAGEVMADSYREMRTEAERIAEKRKEYLASLTDENELLALKASLNGKSSTEQDYQLRVHQAIKEATEAGIDLDSRYLDTQLTMREAIVRKIEDEMQAEAQLAATRETERMKQIEHEKELQKERDRVAERAQFHRKVEQDIQGIIVGSIMRTGDWREMAGRLIEQLAQAYLYAGLFNSGPLAQEGGGKGLLGGITNIISGWLTKSASGNVMTDEGPLPLRKYSRGGIARSPQLSMFGEGRQPEAYVPLPDGRTIPVTIKEPDVPSFAGNAAAMQSFRVAIDLNNEMLEATIVETSAPVSAEITRGGIQQFSETQLPMRVRQSNQDPKRLRS